MSLGNICLDTIRPSDNEQKRVRSLQKATDYFSAALRMDPYNIYAANGIGCVFAAKGKLVEAKEVFVQVREADGEALQPWLNLANVYIEQVSLIPSTPTRCRPGVCEKLSHERRLVLSDLFILSNWVISGSTHHGSSFD